jgi:hypothetical protein
MAFIIFLFYSNLLMGEYTRDRGYGKPLIIALKNIFSVTNFIIAIVAAFIGYMLFEFFRRQL